MAEYHLTAPLSEADVRKLSAGDMVWLSGPVFTCRSRLQRYVLDEGHEFPADTRDRNVLIHVGPVIIGEPGSYRLMSFMPTSSIRFEKWGAKSVAEWGLRMIVGKTTMGAQTMEAMARLGCVHVSPRCVSPNLWLDSITIEDVRLFEELGTIEACWHLQLRELGPFVVDIDCAGNNLFEALDREIAANKEKAYEKLGIPSGFTYTKLY